MFCSVLLKQILHGNVDQTLVNSLHGLVNFEKKVD